jgi:hypothetical protein
MSALARRATAPGFPQGRGWATPQAQDRAAQVIPWRPARHVGLGLSLVKDRARLLYARREALAVAGPSPELLAYGRHHRLDMATIAAHAGFLTVTLGRLHSEDDGSRGYRLTPDGSPLAVIEAILFNAHREPVTADLVAWPLSDPDDVASAMGLNDGADLLGPQNAVKRGGAPLRVHFRPLDWMQAGCEGCVILKPGARHWLRQAGGPFVVRDQTDAARLHDLLGMEGERPAQILIPTERLH